MYLMVSEKLFVITKFQFKLILMANFALAVVLCLLTPFMFGVRYLDSYGSSFILERFISLIGIILLTPLFMPEQDKNIAELVQSKRTEHILTIFLRLVISLLFMMFCIAIMAAVMRFLQCEFETVKFIMGTFATALCLGAIGFAFHAITNNIVIGYLAAFAYYLLNFALGIRLKNMYMFSLARDSINEKYWLFGLGVLLLSVSLLWKNIAAKTSLYK